MGKLLKLINRITEFGLNDDIQSYNKELEIQQLLVGLYSEYLNLDREFDDGDFEEEPTFDYNQIKKNVQANFPDFGWYHSVWECHNVVSNAEVNTGDAIDDLTDIIKDMLAVKWRMENTSEKDSLWNFDFSMRTHSEQHLVNFLKYLKDKNG